MDRNSWIVLAVVFLLSWVLMKWLSLHEGTMGGAQYFLSLWLLTWIPGIAGILAAKWEKIKIPWISEPISALLLSFLSAFFLGICINYNSSPDGGWFVNLVMYPLAALISALADGVPIFWWGYLYKKLEKCHPLIAMLIIGITWGMWYMPLILMASGYHYDYNRIEGVFMMPLLTIALSPLMFYFRRNGKNIFAPALFFGTLMMSACLQTPYQPDKYLIDGITGINGIKAVFFCSVIALGLLWKQGAFKHHSVKREQKLEIQ